MGAHIQESAYRRHRIFGLVAMFILPLLIGFGCRGGEKVVESLPKVDLEYWTVWDEASDFNTLIETYRTQHPNVHITVKKMPFDTYQTDLLAAWARGEGPDLFAMPNTAVGRYKDFITPLPESLNLPTLVVDGGCTKNVRLVREPKATPKPELLDETFIPVVADDVVLRNAIYGLPLSVDTLALYYNKDLLNAAKVIGPPQTWQELTDMVDTSKGGLTKEEKGEIIQSGISLGTASNINRSTDILSALMMQSGTQMMDTTGKSVTFQNSSPDDKEYVPGASALNFYTSFANPVRVSYSWNATLPESQEAFAAGTSAFFVGYSYQLDAIRQQNPRLNFGIAPLPQISSAGTHVNYANYWVQSVAKQSEYPDEAWDFLLFLTQKDQASQYLEKTHQPTALRSLITSQQDDLDLSVFVDQLLEAKTWYHASDDAAMETAFDDMIASVLDGISPEQAITVAAQQVQKTILREDK